MPKVLLHKHSTVENSSFFVFSLSPLYILDVGVEEGHAGNVSLLPREKWKKRKKKRTQQENQTISL